MRSAVARKADCPSCAELAPNDRLRIAATRENQRWLDFASENELDRAWIYGSIQHTLDWLGGDDDPIVAMSASTKVRQDGETNDVTLTMFVHRGTGELVTVYVREGTF